MTVTDVELLVPRRCSAAEFGACSNSVFRELGRQLGEYIDARGKRIHGEDWFERCCASRSYRPHLHDPEFLLKEPDEPGSWCRSCLPKDAEFHKVRRRMRQRRNRWAHFVDVPPEELAELLADVRRLAMSLDLPLAEAVGRLQQHVRYLIANPDVLMADEDSERLSRELATIQQEAEEARQRAERAEAQVAAYERLLLPNHGAVSGETFGIEDLSVLEPSGDVCLHFAYEGSGHMVVAECLSVEPPLARIPFQLHLGVPLGDGDVVTFRAGPNGRSASLTSIQARSNVFRIGIFVDYGPGVLKRILELVSGGTERDQMAVEEMFNAPDGPASRWEDFWTGFTDLVDFPQDEARVVQHRVTMGEAVIEVDTQEKALCVWEAACLQDHGDAWILSTPEAPIGPLSQISGFDYEVSAGRARVEAIRRGWFCEGSDNGQPDANRVMNELYWDPILDTFTERAASQQHGARNHHLAVYHSP